MDSELSIIGLLTNIGKTEGVSRWVWLEGRAKATTHLDSMNIIIFLIFWVNFLFVLRLFAGFVPRVCWISVGGFVFLGAYEKTKQLLGAWLQTNQ